MKRFIKQTIAGLVILFLIPLWLLLALISFPAALVRSRLEESPPARLLMWLDKEMQEWIDKK